MLNSLTIPYGTPRTRSEVWRLKRFDNRPSEAEPRLVWRDRLELRDRQYVVHSRVLTGGIVTPERVRLDEREIECSHMSWKTAPAFDAPTSSRRMWEFVSASGVMIRPTSMTSIRVIDEADDALMQLGLSGDLGSNPLLQSSFRGKRLLVPALSLMMAVVAPSPAVFASLLHPLDARFYATRDIDQVIRIHSLGRLRVADFKDRDLTCLAYWLADGRTSADARLFSAIVGHEPLPAPDAPGDFQFCIEGYENDDTIIVRRLGQFRVHQCWPMDWRQVCLIDERGQIGSEVFALPDGKLSALQSPRR